MKGVPLSVFTDELRKVPAHMDRRPVASFDVVEAMGPDAQAEARERYGEALDFEQIRRLPARYFADLSFDQICKIRASSILSMSSSMQEEMEQDPRHALFDRIRSSMWHWGTHRPAWSEYVDAYDGIRRFTLDLPGFEVAIDYVSTYRKDGDADHSGTWLDGHMAYMVHHRGEHVMTLGFSIMGRRRLLIQQVQLASPRGNRWLYSFPSNRLEFILDRFCASFPRHAVHIVDGTDLVENNLAGYRESLKKIESRGGIDGSGYRDRIAHLEADAPRLASFYAERGRYRTTGTIRVNGLQHHALAA